MTSAWVATTTRALTDAACLPRTLPVIDITSTFNQMHTAPPHKGVFDERTPLRPPNDELLLLAQATPELRAAQHIQTLTRPNAPEDAFRIEPEELHLETIRRITLTTHVLLTRTYWVHGDTISHTCGSVTWLDQDGCLLRHAVTPPDPSDPHADHFTPREWREALPTIAWPIRIALEALADLHPHTPTARARA